VSIEGVGGVPPAVREGVEASWGDRIHRVRPVSGGCIHRAVRVEGEGGRTAFLKWSAEMSPAIFSSEAAGLRALAGAVEGGHDVRVPAVLGWGGGEGGVGWLLLEWVEPGPLPADGGRRLGLALSTLHRPVEGGWGWPASNHIGPLLQSNTPRATWGEFWRDERLEPLLRRAMDRGGFRDRRARGAWRALLDRVETWLEPADAEGASLLHGDLWSGNLFFSRMGEPVLVDPAVYRGHREVDLAMLDLFGGIPVGTREAYEEVAPLAPTYAGIRRDLYQLYPLLVHLLLFGGAYEAPAMQRVGRLLRG
jgi:protein-ribulosamine 3-kinase